MREFCINLIPLSLTGSCAEGLARPRPSRKPHHLLDMLKFILLTTEKRPPGRDPEQDPNCVRIAISMSAFEDTDDGHVVDYQTTSQLVIGIDFGTTFTGVAYYVRTQTASSDPSQIAKDVAVVTIWPNSDASTRSSKTPSIIAYSANPPLWGPQVGSGDEPQVTLFKLGLEPTTREHYRAPDPTQAPRGHTNPLFNNRRPNISNKQPVDITADYLTGIYRYVRDQRFREQFGEHFLENQRTTYVITVPSIWSDYAQNLTKVAATRAGIPEGTIHLITEPEAAALYCATISEEVDLSQNDRFLVCDAGGGTVVLTLEHPFSL